MIAAQTYAAANNSAKAEEMLKRAIEAEPSHLMVIVFVPPKKVPPTVTVALGFPLVGVSVIAGLTARVVLPELIRCVLSPP